MSAPEHLSNKGIPLNLDDKLRPFGRDEVLSANDLDEGLPEAFAMATDEYADLFSHPDEKVIIDKVAGDYLEEDQALAQIQQWKAKAQEQGMTGENSNRVIISLFDLSGEWVRPWAEAGYDVYCFDIQNGHDITEFDVAYFTENYNFCDIYAIFAACPCTDFASSGARHFSGKDEDGRTEASKELVFQAMRTIEYFRPTIWALENPVGRIERLTGLPNARMTFHPHHFGEDYTKKTLLWGRFNAALPTANRPPSQGSKMHTLYGGKSIATKNARSATPEGFAYAFFAANNYKDLPLDKRMTYDYPEVSGAVLEALDAGFTEQEIKNIIDDHYGNEDYDSARNALAYEVVNTLSPSR